RQPRQQVGGVAEMQADVVETTRLDQRQRLRHAVDERLAPDEARARMRRRFRTEMLAPAEADLEADVVDRTRKQRGEPIGRRAEIDREPRQQRLHQRRLMRAQRMALAPAEEGAAASRVVALARRQRCYLRLSMIFSENRHPLFGIML